MNQIIKACSKKEKPIKIKKVGLSIKCPKIKNNPRVKKDYKLEKKVLERKDFLKKMVNEKDNEEHIQDVEKLYNNWNGCHTIVGTHSVERKLKIAYRKIIYRFIGIFVLLPILYIIAIYFYDIYKG